MMQHRGNPHQQRQEDDVISRFKNLLREKDLRELSDRDIFHPQGYGKKLAERLNIQNVQLRRIYQEFKALYELAKENAMDKLKPRLYKLYAIVEYQAKRNVISDNVKDVIHKILDNIEKHLPNNPQMAIENIKKAYDLMMAIVAYSKTR